MVNLGGDIRLVGPRSGWPVANWQSVSVVAPACLAAGALTTIAMLKGAKALDFLELQRVDYIAVDAHGRVHRGAAQGTDPRFR